MRYSARTPFTFLSLLLGLPATAFAGTWVVAADGTGQFKQIQPAVDAAQSGDLIRVMNGSYEPFTVIGKSVMIVGEGADKTVIGNAKTSSIRSAKGGLAEVARMKFEGDLNMSSNAEPVMVLDCEGRGLTLSNNLEVQIEKWKGLQGNATDVATLWLIDSSFQGTAGLNAISGPHGDWAQFPTIGGDAFRASNSKMYISNTQFNGGVGGAGVCASQGMIKGKVGGNGLRLLSHASAWIAGGNLAGGNGGIGQSFASSCAPESSGKAIVAIDSAKIHWDKTGEQLFPIHIQGPSVVGEHTTIEFFGNPGDMILFLLSAKTIAPIPLALQGVDGFPLALELTGANFWFLDRAIEDDGSLLWKHKLPNAPELIGVPIYTQAFLYAPVDLPQHTPAMSSMAFSVLTAE